MPPWTDPFWIAFGVIATVFFGLVGVVAWRWPRAPKQPKPAKHETVWVDVENAFPVFDHPDGSSEIGDHLVGVTLHNGSGARVRAVSWGIKLPGDKRIFVRIPATSYEPRLPHWVEPGDAATWYIKGDDLFRQQKDLGCAFDEMRPYVSLADGRELDSERPVPLGLEAD